MRRLLPIDRVFMAAILANKLELNYGQTKTKSRLNFWTWPPHENTKKNSISFLQFFKSIDGNTERGGKRSVCGVCHNTSPLCGRAASPPPLLSQCAVEGNFECCCGPFWTLLTPRVITSALGNAGGGKQSRTDLSYKRAGSCSNVHDVHTSIARGLHKAGALPSKRTLAPSLSLSLSLSLLYV